MSTTLIPPEIKDDEFYHTIVRLSREEHLTHVLEIGSSAGGGSTEAFVSGLKENPCRPTMYCLEVSAPRFAELHKRYEPYGFVKAYHMSSVPTSTFMSEEEVRKFYTTHATKLSNYPLTEVLGWLQSDIEYVQNARVAQNGIEAIKRENKIDCFDLVLIDGSAFTGMAELAEVYGARLILLDDINDIKCLDVYELLKADPLYQLELENWTVRNGFAVFRRVSTQTCVPCSMSLQELRRRVPGTTLTPKGVVVVCPNNIIEQDFVNIALPKLREHYGSSTITVVCQDMVAPDFTTYRQIDRVIPYNKSKVLLSQEELKRFVAEVGVVRPDVTINVGWSFDLLSHMIALSLGAPIRVACTDDASSLSANDAALHRQALERYSVITRCSSVERYQELLRGLGCRQSENRSSPMLLPPQGQALAPEFVIKALL